MPSRLCGGQNFAHRELEQLAAALIVQCLEGFCGGQNYVHRELEQPVSALIV